MCWGLQTLPVVIHRKNLIGTRWISPAAGLRPPVCPVADPCNPVSPVAVTWTYMPPRPQLHSSCWYRPSHRQNLPGLPMSHRWSHVLLLLETHRHSHSQSWPIQPFVPRPLYLFTVSSGLTFSSAHPLTYTATLTAAAGTPGPPTCGLTCSCWHSGPCRPTSTLNRMPLTQEGVRKEFTMKIRQALLRRRAWLDMGTEQPSIYRKLALLIPLTLFFPMYFPPQIT